MSNRNVLLAVVVCSCVVGLINPAQATDGVVTWQLTTDTPTVNPNGASPFVNWYSAVTVTGTNQGLAFFLYDIEVDNAGGTPVNVTLETASWQEPFAVAGAAGKPATGAAVTAPGNLGGPGMSVMASGGYNMTNGLLVQCASGYISWEPWRLVQSAKGDNWSGTASWGVGLDSRKSTLLLDPTGAYGIQTGRIPVATLAPGVYTVKLTPGGHSVLKADVDLSVSQNGSVSDAVPAANVSGSSFTFTVESTGGGGTPPPTPLTAAFSFAPDASDPATIKFDASGSTGDALTYQWAFGDGQTGSGVQASHKYANGTWTAVLTVGDSHGASATKNATIAVSVGGGTTPPPDGGTTPPPDGGTTPPPDGGTTPPPDGGDSTPTPAPVAVPLCGAGVTQMAMVCMLGLFALQLTRRRY